jgi:hypothetical protein
MFWRIATAAVLLCGSRVKRWLKSSRCPPTRTPLGGRTALATREDKSLIQCEVRKTSFLLLGLGIYRNLLF